MLMDDQDQTAAHDYCTTGANLAGNKKHLTSRVLYLVKSDVILRYSRCFITNQIIRIWITFRTSVNGSQLM